MDFQSCMGAPQDDVQVGALVTPSGTWAGQ